MINLIYIIYFLKFYFHHCVLRDEMNKTIFTCICFEECLNQLNLLYIYICLYLQHDKSYESNGPHYGLQSLSEMK
jgi:hypothetical protein